MLSFVEEMPSLSCLRFQMVHDHNYRVDYGWSGAHTGHLHDPHSLSVIADTILRTFEFER